MVMAEVAAVTRTKMTVTMAVTVVAIVIVVMVVMLPAVLLIEAATATAGKAMVAMETMGTAVAMMIEEKMMEGVRRVGLTMEKTMSTMAMIMVALAAMIVVKVVVLMALLAAGRMKTAAGTIEMEAMMEVEEEEVEGERQAKMTTGMVIAMRTIATVANKAKVSAVPVMMARARTKVEVGVMGTMARVRTTVVMTTMGEARAMVMGGKVEEMIVEETTMMVVAERIAVVETMAMTAIMMAMMAMSRASEAALERVRVTEGEARITAEVATVPEAMEKVLTVLMAMVKATVGAAMTTVMAVEAAMEVMATAMRAWCQWERGRGCR